ncbi:hypothetical protein [uncultured Clostridium sp.]|uniref:hypothetical protein n=1 Tax=uncultured Clostridium sp. TaxID=59620 RepID=UPI0028EE0CCB|nr:hypothetical protein [uncultured Clostridium sp.]
MEENILNVEDEKEKVVTQRLIKRNIRKYMNNEEINIFSLSKETQINLCKLIFLIYYPFSRIKLSNSFEICKALNLQLPKLLE